MNELFTILNIPILQAIGVVVLIGIAERIGIPVISILKSIFKINGNTRIKELEEELELTKNNHNRHLEIIIEKLDKILEEEAINHTKIITILENINNK